MNIYQKLSAITAEMATVAKNLEVSAGKSGKYKAVSERDILAAVKPLEEKHGVYSYPVLRETLESERLETETQYGQKTSFYTRIKTVYRFVNIDDPKDFIETTTFSVGLDSGDKGDGKAMTYGDKYALMKAYKISTGEDPDQSASEESKYVQKTPEETDPEKRTQLINEINALMRDFSTDEKRTIFSQAREKAGVAQKASGVMTVSELTKVKTCVVTVIGGLE